MDVLDKRFTKKHDLNQSTLVALGSLNLILVIVVYPIVRNLFKLPRPDNIPKGTVPSISWGKG